MSSEEQIMTITVWDKGEAFCGQCHSTKTAFDRAGVTYQTRDVTAPEHAEQLAAFKEAGAVQAPIVETPTKTWSGFRPDLINDAAKRDLMSSDATWKPGLEALGSGQKR